MKILLNKNDLNEALYSVSNLGFVPTMGSLHEGHMSLIKKSMKECKKTLVSIFINPTQFNNKIDFKNYPKSHKRDLSILKKLNVDFVFVPKNNDIYNYKRTKKIKLMDELRERRYHVKPSEIKRNIKRRQIAENKKRVRQEKAILLEEPNYNRKKKTRR